MEVTGQVGRERLASIIEGKIQALESDINVYRLFLKLFADIEEGSPDEERLWSYFVKLGR